jgi:hypothetical protein
LAIQIANASIDIEAGVNPAFFRRIVK